MGCLRSRTEPCPGQDFTCPADLVCAAPGYCGPRAQVEECEGLEEWSPCIYDDAPETPGSCHHGICEACTSDREGCATSSNWLPMSLPADSDLNNIWVRARADVYAVGNFGVLLHYDGTAWSNVITSPPIPMGIDLKSIWGSDANDYYIVTSDAAEKNLLHVKDGALSFEGMASSLQGIWGTAANNVYGVGLGGVIVHFNGTSWEPMSSGTNQTLFAVSGADAARVIAISTSGAFTLFDGTSWKSGSIGTALILHGLWVGTRDAYVAGEGRTLLRFDGTSWTPAAIDLSIPSNIVFFAVWSSGAEYFAVGNQGTIATSTDGMSWAAVTPQPGNNELHAVAGSGADDVFAVGANGAIWHRTTHLR